MNTEGEDTKPMVATRSGKKQGVTPEEQARALLKEQQLQSSRPGVLVSGTTTNSSKRSCPSQVNMNNIIGNNGEKVDPYLLKLLHADEVAIARANTVGTMGTMGTMGAMANRSGSTEFRVPEPPVKKAKLDEARADKPPLSPPMSPAAMGKPPPHPKTASHPRQAQPHQPHQPHQSHQVALQVPLPLQQPAPVPPAVDIQASNSLEKTKTTQPSTDKLNASDKAAKISGAQSAWDASDTRSVLGEDVYDTLKSSVVQHQKEYLEQLFDLHRAIAVQHLLVRHSEDQTSLIREYKKEEARAKKALQKAGLGFGTTTEWHKGLRPDSQFAALSSDQGTDAGSGDDGSVTDVGASGSGGNGKSGNGSGGGSTSQFAPQLARAPILPGIQRTAPSGASNTPMLGPWSGFGQVGQMGPMGPMGQIPGSFGVNNGGSWNMEMPMYPSNVPYGDPMLYWYQDYCARLQQQGKSQNGAAAVPGAPGAPGANNTVPNNTTASPTQARPVAVPPVPPIFKVESRKPPGGIGPFKWWQDPKAVFAPPGTKEVLKRVQAETGTRQEGNEVESAPPSEDATAEEDTQPAKKTTRKNNTKNNTKKNTKKNTTTNTTNDDEENAEAEDQPAAKPTPRARRPRKRLLKDPVAAASSGTSGPLPHYSSDGTNPRQHDAVGNVAKLLMSISTKEAGGGASSGPSITRRRTSRKSSG